MSTPPIRSTAPLVIGRSRLTDKDWKYLEDKAGKPGRTLQRGTAACVVFFIIMGIIRCYLAAWLANHEGYTFYAFLTRFSAGTSSEETYSGIFIKAADSMTMGIFFFFAAVLHSICWWNGRRERERTQRILNALKGGDVL